MAPLLNHTQVLTFLAFLSFIYLIYYFWSRINFFLPHIRVYWGFYLALCLNFCALLFFLVISDLVVICFNDDMVPVYVFGFTNFVLFCMIFGVNKYMSQYSVFTRFLVSVLMVLFVTPLVFKPFSILSKFYFFELRKGLVFSNVLYEGPQFTIYIKLTESLIKNSLINFAEVINKIVINMGFLPDKSILLEIYQNIEKFLISVNNSNDVELIFFNKNVLPFTVFNFTKVETPVLSYFSLLCGFVTDTYESVVSNPVESFLAVVAFSAICYFLWLGFNSGRPPTNGGWLSYFGPK